MHGDTLRIYFPTAKTGRPAKWDHKTTFHAILWIARNGSAWWEPGRYPPHQSVYSRFCKWRDNGTLLRIFQSLNADTDMEILSLDSTVIKAHPHSAGTKKGL